MPMLTRKQYSRSAMDSRNIHLLARKCSRCCSWRHWPLPRFVSSPSIQIFKILRQWQIWQDRWPKHPTVGEYRLTAAFSPQAPPPCPRRPVARPRIHHSSVNSSALNSLVPKCQPGGAEGDAPAGLVTLSRSSLKEE